MSTSRKSEKSAASVHDTNYRQWLRYRNIYVNRGAPPPELMRRAERIISRSRTSPDMDDEAVQQVIRTSRMIEDEVEEVILQQLAPDVIPAMKTLPDGRLASNASQLWCNCVPIPLKPSILTDPLPLPRPKPDRIFGYSEEAFTESQLGTIDLLVDDYFGRSYAIPDQKIRFPFLEIDVMSQAKNGTHYIVTNQAAGAGAIALNGNLELMRRSSGLEKFDYEEPLYFSITEGRHSFHVAGLSKHLLDDANGIRALSRAIKNILDNGTDVRLRALCVALDAYRETVIRDRNAARQRPKSGARAPRPHLADGASHLEAVGISRTPINPAPTLPSGQRARRGVSTPEVHAGAVTPYEEVRTSRPPVEPIRPMHTEQRPQRAGTAKRRPAQNPVDIPAKSTPNAAQRLWSTTKWLYFGIG
ncbi:hypothetical protein AYL99_07962 [Fonsecaea erecta]|uniref:DUF7924 domain-containing protein n=1 Tax=Fonsecaea erecta TaxID=1367422 RepID=A0A178ZBR5_9EURO|nr:hypothetical protein AYL99_07962 [Fonsecaea erecta]OAP57224.1 hypothetical protein AYL99_07962 [Fonsecaea erecta]